MSYISPSTFVKVDSKIEALFDDNTWYDATVVKIHEYGTDSFGKYVKCDIIYDDGDYDENIQLYDEYFETMEEEAWKFKGEFSKLITAFNNAVEDMDNMRSDIDTLMENVADLIDEKDAEDDNMSDDTAYEVEGSEVEKEPVKTNIFGWYLFGHVVSGLIGFGVCQAIQCYNYECNQPIWVDVLLHSLRN
jgi:hypothetical protein